MKKILVIEDDLTIIEALEDTFRFHDFDVVTAGDGKEGLALFIEHQPDIIILDVMLPRLDGFEICKKIRQENPLVPIIMLTARSQESDKLLGFELGADAYVTKPFSVKVLVAQVQAILKRSDGNNKEETPKKEKNESVTIGKAIVHFESFTIIQDNKEYALSPKEIEILKLFVSFPNKVIDRNMIIDKVWGDEYFPSPRTIDNFILKLRNKIEEDPRNPLHILTVHGAGYKFKP